MSVYEADIAAELNAALAKNAALRASNAEMLAALREIEAMASINPGAVESIKLDAIEHEASLAIARATEAAS